MRFRYLPGEGVVPVEQWWQAQTRRKHSHLAKPFIRSDGMDPLVSHADGQIYDSRSAYDSALKAKGCHVIEAGEQTGGAPILTDEVGGLEQDIKDAIEKVEAGYVG